MEKEDWEEERKTYFLSPIPFSCSKLQILYVIYLGSTLIINKPNKCCIGQ